MRKVLYTALLLSLSLTCFAQPPQRPLLALNAYTLEGYQAIAVSEAFDIPDSIEIASVTSVAFNSAGNLIVLHRGEVPFLEFDAEGTFIRAFGAEDLFIRSHGLHIDDNDNLWVTDVSGQVVMKLNSDAEILMTLGTKGEAGNWNEASASHMFNQPNEVAIDSADNIYVAQGHGTGAEPKILKFNPNGEFITQWGSRGDGPGEFLVAHSMVIDADDNIYVADRENQRIQIFDTTGNYLNEWNFAAMACAIFLHDDGFMYMTTGFDGELAKLDMEGNVLGSIGKPGSEVGQFGEGHFLTVDSTGNIYVADVVNRRVQKYAKQ
jgi:DNA-binding beta-propeller fold protein YncE